MGKQPGVHFCSPASAWGFGLFQGPGAGLFRFLFAVCFYKRFQVSKDGRWFNKRLQYKNFLVHLLSSMGMGWWSIYFVCRYLPE